jgi:hypothetical protein
MMDSFPRVLVFGLISILLTYGCGPDIKVWTEKFPDSDQVREEHQYYNGPETNVRVKEG